MLVFEYAGKLVEILDEELDAYVSHGFRFSKAKEDDRADALLDYFADNTFSFDEDDFDAMEAMSSEELLSHLTIE